MLIAGVFMTSGVQDVIRELQKHKGAAQLTGFGLAMAVAEKVEADLRVSLASAALRAAAKAGFDVGNSASVFTTIKDARVYIEVVPMDLADMAGAADDQQGRD